MNRAGSSASISRMNDNNDNNRRGTPRVHLMLEVEVGHAGRAFLATTLDISRTGMSIWTSDALPPTGPVTLSFVLDNVPLTITGRVARAYPSDGGSVWGVAFGSLDVVTRSRLSNFLQRHQLAETA